MKTLELEAHNLRKPTCPDIVINPKEWGSETEPQACKYKGNWYYNAPAFEKETKFIGKRVPTHEEWQEILKETPANKIFDFVGCRYFGTTGTFNSRTTGVYVWSSFEASTTVSWVEYFYSSIPTQSVRNSVTEAYGFSVRCLKNSSDSSSL